MSPFDQSHPEAGSRAIPNSVFWEQRRDSQLVEFRINNCGHRTRLDCHSKPPGAYRIVLVGSSVPMGTGLPENQTIASRLPEDISRLTGHTVEVYNEGMITMEPEAVTLRFQEVLEPKPDMIVWLLTPYDIFTQPLPDPDIRIPPEKMGTLRKEWIRAQEAYKAGPFSGVAHHLNAQLLRTSLGVLLLHCLNESLSQFLHSTLMGEDLKSDYLKVQPSAQWKLLLQEFDRDDALIQERANAANVPLVVVLVPNHVQAALISMGEWPDSLDPYKLGDEIRTIVTSHDGTFLDVSPYFHHLPNAEQYYFAVDGHPNAPGSAAISEMMAKELTGVKFSALAANRRSQFALEHGK
jgi:hypothetical protein